jgi:hypothetical protein
MDWNTHKGLAPNGGNRRRFSFHQLDGLGRQRLTFSVADRLVLLLFLTLIVYSLFKGGP